MTTPIIINLPNACPECGAAVLRAYTSSGDGWTLARADYCCGNYRAAGPLNMRCGTCLLVGAGASGVSNDEQSRWRRRRPGALLRRRRQRGA